jgi:hypothetical protein
MFLASLSRITLAPVFHTYNPAYSEGRDQEDRGSKPEWANSAARPYFEKTLHKERAGGVAQGVGPEFKPQYCQKKNSIRLLPLCGLISGSLLQSSKCLCLCQ